MTDTPTDRESVEERARLVEANLRPSEEFRENTVSTLRALLSRAEKAEAERDALREAGDALYSVADTNAPTDILYGWYELRRILDAQI